MDETGQFLAFKVKTTANMGLTFYLASSVPTYLYGTLLAGQYRTPAIYVEVDSVLRIRHLSMRIVERAARGYLFGERIVTKAATELGKDPKSFAARNLSALMSFLREHL